MTETPNTPISTTTDPRPQFAAAYALAGKVIAGVRPDQLDLPTPCEQFTVEGLLGHLRLVADRAALLGRRVSPFSAEPPPAPADGDHARWWQDKGHEIQQGWPDERLTETVVLPWATVTGADALAGYLNELNIHTWDLAVATGQAVAWDDEAIEVGLTALKAMLPAGGRHEAFEAARQELPEPMRSSMQHPFAEAVTLPADAPLIEHAVAYTGRDPRPWR